MQPKFTLTPGSALGPAPVHLTLPAGFKLAGTSLTDNCDRPIAGSSLTLSGTTATPHYPPGWTGQGMVAFKIAQDGPHAGVSMTMTMAARESINGGTAAVCPTGSPYAAAAPPVASPSVSVPASHALVVTAQSSSLTEGYIGLAVIVALVAGSIALFLRRRRRRAHAR